MNGTREMGCTRLLPTVTLICTFTSPCSAFLYCFSCFTRIYEGHLVRVLELRLKLSRSKLFLTRK